MSTIRNYDTRAFAGAAHGRDPCVSDHDTTSALPVGAAHGRDRDIARIDAAAETPAIAGGAVGPDRGMTTFDNIAMQQHRVPYGRNP